jgi:cytochrome c oxidase subunit II
VTDIVFTPLEAGVYLGQCAEFCGESHALMKMRLIAHEPEDFERWLANEAQPAVAPADSAVALGQQLVTGWHLRGLPHRSRNHRAVRPPGRI